MGCTDTTESSGVQFSPFVVVETPVLGQKRSTQDRRRASEKSDGSRTAHLRLRSGPTPRCVEKRVFGPVR